MLLTERHKVIQSSSIQLHGACVEFIKRAIELMIRTIAGSVALRAEE